MPEGVLGRVPLCGGGTSCGLHGPRCEGVPEGDIAEVVDFSGPPCLPVRPPGVGLGAVQGIVDSRPLRVGVNGNVGARCRVYPDSLCGSPLGRLVVVPQGCAFSGGRALGGYKEVHGLCWLYLVWREEAHDFHRCYPWEDFLPIDGARR